MNFLHYIKDKLGVELDDIAQLPYIITSKKIEKDTILTDYDVIEDKVYFLKSGIVEYTIFDKNNEKILDFIFEGSVFSSYESLLMQIPSDIKITAITNIEIEAVNYQDLKNSFKTSLLANQIARIATELSYCKIRNREKNFLTKTAEERYVDLLDKRKDIISVIPVHKIAKYLGIHPESLSRIRKYIFIKF